eukprot:5587237-Prymnesium_polylepis.1
MAATPSSTHGQRSDIAAHARRSSRDAVRARRGEALSLWRLKARPDAGRQGGGHERAAGAARAP